MTQQLPQGVESIGRATLERMSVRGEEFACGELRLTNVRAKSPRWGWAARLLGFRVPYEITYEFETIGR